MKWHYCLLALTTILALTIGALADTHESTRVVDADQYAPDTRGRYPYRDKSRYVLQELDLRARDVVVDIGAGDGFWTKQMAEAVGPAGVVHAAEVDRELVDKLKRQFRTMPQAKPYLCPTDGTALPEDSCDLAFLSKTYHHLNAEGRIDYWRHLREVVKPTGRVCVIERHPGLSTGRGRDHAFAPALLAQQAEEGGWILVRYELIAGTRHYLAIFVQRDLFDGRR
jgi:predicted methyltransferase